jgi:glycosyltransferase involved in cell wall biosynthesis
MGELLADPQLRIRMGRAGRERALRLFDWEQTAEKFAILFQKLVTSRGRNR